MPLRPDPAQDPGTPGELHGLHRVLADPRAQRTMARDLSHISRTWALPALAGSSEDARVLYIDRAIPTQVLVHQGQVRRLVPVLGTLIMHERTLRALMESGLGEDGAGVLAAAGTSMRVRQAGVAWPDWATAVRAYLRDAVVLADLPPDLDPRGQGPLPLVSATPATHQQPAAGA